MLLLLLLLLLFIVVVIVIIVYSDRLTELEKEKTILADQLKHQEKEAMFKEIEIMRIR